MYEVPKSKASLKQNRFEFKVGAKKFDVPLLKYLPGTVIEFLAEAEEKGDLANSAAQYAVFGEKGTPIGDAVRTLDSDQLDNLTDAYVKASRGVDLGESSASTDS